MLSITVEDRMDILEKLNGIGWIIVCFAVLYFGGHLIVALVK